MKIMFKMLDVFALKNISRFSFEPPLQMYTHNLVFSETNNTFTIFYLKIFIFTAVKNPSLLHMSRVMRKSAFCICQNKDADQLRGNRKADQRLCFRYIDSTIPLFSKSSSHLLLPYSLVCVGPGRKPRRPVFSQRGSYVCYPNVHDEPCHEKPCFLHMRKQSCRPAPLFLLHRQYNPPSP